MEQIKLEEVTPEKASELTAMCKEVEHCGGGRWGENVPRYCTATMWCWYTSEALCERGETVLEAVVKVHNKFLAIADKHK